MKLLRLMSRHSNVLRSTGPRYFTSTVSDRTSAVNKRTISVGPFSTRKIRSTLNKASSIKRTPASTQFLGPIQCHEALTLEQQAQYYRIQGCSDVAPLAFVTDASKWEAQSRFRPQASRLLIFCPRRSGD